MPAERGLTEDFIRSVDGALYRAKRAGGQQVKMQTSEIQPAPVLEETR